MNRIFFEWIAKCCELLGKPKEYGIKLLDDICWFNCYEEGYTPEEAVEEYKKSCICGNNDFEEIIITAAKEMTKGYRGDARFNAKICKQCGLIYKIFDNSLDENLKGCGNCEESFGLECRYKYLGKNIAKKES